MSQPLPIEQFPGYVPPGKAPFWTRTKAAVTAGVGGLVIGLLIGAGGAASTDEPEADEPAEVVDTSQLTEDDVAEAVDEAVDEAVGDAVADETARMQEKLDRQRASAQARIDEAKQRVATAAERAMAKAVARVRAEEREKAAQAVADARAEAEEQEPVPFTGGGTDPMFDYCYEVDDAGYGPYYEGQDPEYDWYDDADGDGVVCE
jgi:hypothetical protein